MGATLASVSMHLQQLQVQLKYPMPTKSARAPASPQPQGCTNFKLRQLLRSVARLYDTQLALTGLKTTQYSLLSHVVSLAPIAPSALATRMGLDASTLTRNLRPLVEQGWCEQGPGADARSRSISITAAGRAKHAEARTHWKRAQLSLNQRLGDEQVVALHAMIEQVQLALADADADAAHSLTP
jgi:DNA-binding MarR family transcriptional regulator